MSTGWWTYEVCFGRSVSQVHEDNGHIVANTSLGLFSSDYDWDRAVMQFYRNGDSCDLTGAPRSTELRLICSENPVTTILDVVEPETCSYLLRVGVPELCRVDALAPLKETVPLAIACSPALTKAEFSKHTEAEANYKRELDLANELKKFEKLQSRLPLLRKAKRTEVLNSLRSYRTRQKLLRFLELRRLRRHILAFVRLVSSNFAGASSLSVAQILSTPDLRSVIYGSSVGSSEKWPLYDLDHLARLFANITAAEVKAAKSDMQNPSGPDVHTHILHTWNLLLTHVRRTFEGFVESRHRPHLDLMMAGLVNVMGKLATLRDSKFLSQIQSAIANATASWQWPQPADRRTDIIAYMTSSLFEDRETLNTVNLTLALYQRSLKFYEFNVNVKMMLHKELGLHNLLLNKRRTANKDPTSAAGEDTEEDEASVASAEEVDDLDEAAIEQALSEDSSLPSDSSALDKELAGIQAALQSPQVKATLEKLSHSTKNVVVMKADVQQMDDGMLAILVKVDTKDETSQQQQENEKSYAFRVRPTN
ncbi:Protein OS-9 [Sparganum proliferum]